ITVECLDEIADFAGRKKEVAAITEQAMRGELEFEAALRARIGMLGPLPEATLATAYAERVKLMPGA
ncbi:MAG TPA: phosphoserine phosphatase SerB, partial [Alphaproteobacteria bacterium]|nr:phosphoserine phosphatase SerB [Alphaproteobacteria bacterium]